MELAMHRRELRAVRVLGARAGVGVREHPAEREAELEDLVEGGGDGGRLQEALRVQRGQTVLVRRDQRLEVVLLLGGAREPG